MTPAPSLSSDRPLTRREEDRLNRVAFADRIATTLAAQPEGSGVVVGVYGPWGSGKTTVLNLLHANLATNDAVVAQDLNPWRVADADSLFRALSAAGIELSEKQIGEFLSAFDRGVSTRLTTPTRQRHSSQPSSLD